MKIANTLRPSIIGRVPRFVNRPNYKTQRNQRIFELRSQGLSYNQIARHPEINLTTQRVQKIVSDYMKYIKEEAK